MTVASDEWRALCADFPSAHLQSSRGLRPRRSPEGFLSARIRVGADQVGFTAEGEFELAGNLGPKFAEHVETHVLKDAVAHPLRGRGETALVVRVIGVAQHDGACGAQPLGTVEHAIAVVALRHYRMLDGMEQASAGPAMDHAVVARVL